MIRDMAIASMPRKGLISTYWEVINDLGKETAIQSSVLKAQTLLEYKIRKLQIRNRIWFVTP